MANQLETLKWEKTNKIKREYNIIQTLNNKLGINLKYT